MSKPCRGANCSRRAVAGWSLCRDCLMALLDGHVVRPSAVVPSWSPASPPIAARPEEDWAPGELMEVWGK